MFTKYIQSDFLKTIGEDVTLIKFYLQLLLIKFQLFSTHH